jgi:adenine-specific DNA-methyltransferase
MTEQNNSASSIAHSPIPADDRRAQLAALVPDAFSEGKLDVAALKRALGEEAVIEGFERYALTWAGKANAYKVLQTPSTATLRPQRDLSVNFDQAQHVFIEGENLEVLKVLQKAYFGKVKLIYIDPPYNTGSDSFIYPDRFQESKEDYLRRINELADDGTLMREGFFRKNSKENGHYHSNWLSMMLPRLYIARNLLREDGVIFVSCDDNEVHNLRCLMNEVFGEENFIAQNIWKKSYGGGSKVKHIVVLHEYVLCYARVKERLGVIELPPDPKVLKYYKFKDGKFEVRGPYRLQPLATTSMDERENLRFPILHEGEEIWPEKQWQWSQDRVLAAQANDELSITRIKGAWSVNYKQYLRDEEGVERGAKPFSVLDGPYTQTGTDEIKALFGDGKVFPFPKPKGLIRYFLTFVHDDPNALILDFFAGSCPTAHALIEWDVGTASNRRFICVQLPETTEEGSEAKAAGFETIAEISRSRISKAIEAVNAEADLATSPATNLGFKSFLLTPSNFKQWRGDGIDTPEQLAEQMQMFTKAEKEGAQVEHMLYELLLKFGQELTTPVETLEFALTPSPSPASGRGEQTRVFAIQQRKMLFVLESFTDAMIQPLVDLKPREIIAIDGVFHDSDTLKTNLDLQCRDADIKFTCL